MIRVTEREQDDRLADLERRVLHLEGESSVREDYLAILAKLDLLERENTRWAMSLVVLTELAMESHARLARLVELAEPKGSVVINVGPVSDI